MAKGKFQEWLTEDGLTLLEGWARRGLTNEQIAHNCGITVTTLTEWRKLYPAISAALKKGKEVTVFELENSLYKSANGYYYEEEGKQKYMSSNTTALIFALKNRCPERWREKNTVEVATQENDVANILKAMIEDATSEPEKAEE